jgi:adenylylsulfate reductase subunit A
VFAAMGGAVHVFKPRSSGEGQGRAWYPPWNAGASAYFTLKAGAEMTCQEVRFIPVRFKDAYGPVGAWFLLFKSRATNAFGGEYMQERRDELGKWGPYGSVKPIPANLRNWLGMLDVMEGKGPIYMRTEEAIQKIADQSPDEKTYKKKMKELESEAWEDFLDMTISQAILWAATNTAPEEKPSEIAAAEPYFIGSHSGASGAWVSGPKDLLPTSTSGATRTCPRSRACSAPVTRRAPPPTSSPPAPTPRDASPARRPSASSSTRSRSWPT